MLRKYFWRKCNKEKERIDEHRMPKKIFTQELEGTQERIERGSRKRSSSGGSEKMERVCGR
jgi:hypothetical protein